MTDNLCSCAGLGSAAQVDLPVPGLMNGKPHVYRICIHLPSEMFGLGQISFALQHLLVGHL